MRKFNIYIVVFWAALGAFVSAYSHYKLGLGKIHSPGPGFMPFLLGLLFFIVSFYLLISSLFRRGEQEVGKGEEKGRTNFGKIGLVLVSLFFYGLFIETLGYLIVTLFTMILLFWGMGLERWRTIWVASGLTVLFTYFLFTYLGVRFPPGVLRLVGLY